MRDNTDLSVYRLEGSWLVLGENMCYKTVVCGAEHCTADGMMFHSSVESLTLDAGGVWICVSCPVRFQGADVKKCYFL